MSARCRGRLAPLARPASLYTRTSPATTTSSSATPCLSCSGTPGRGRCGWPSSTVTARRRRLRITSSALPPTTPTSRPALRHHGVREKGTRRPQRGRARRGEEAARPVRGRRQRPRPGRLQNGADQAHQPVARARLHPPRPPVRTTLLIVVVLAGLAGVVAAILPSRRAAKLNILQAIVTE